MYVLYFVLAMILLTLAHITKIIRQSQFIKIYEKPPYDSLSKALSITFLLNLILPFKLGNIFRIIYPSKNLKNGKSIIFATIVIDILLDFFTITLLYVVIGFMKRNAVMANVKFYVIISIVLLIFFMMAHVFKKKIKKIILIICGIFNDNIKFKLLKITWCSILSFKDMIKRINKMKLLAYTIVSAILYNFSYFCFAKFLTSIQINLNFMNIFNIIYGRKNILYPAMVVFYNYLGTKGGILLLVYILIPIGSIFLCSNMDRYLPKRFSQEEKYANLFLHINAHDKFVFLEKYFSAENETYYQNYIKLNKDVAIIQDLSTGSKATLILCNQDGKTFYRKYSMGEDAKKLYSQIQWLEDHQNNISLTPIMNVCYLDGLCSYDMPYVQNYINFFNYIHTMPFEKTWENIKRIWNDLETNLYVLNRKMSNEENIVRYIDTKMVKNIESIKNSQYIKPLMKYEYLYINGKKYHNLDYYIHQYLNMDYLKEIFKNDYYSDIHGDLTIENILYLKEYKSEGNPYYLIDPNTGNIHNSPYLDYAKMLQSLHGGYEFLMQVNDLQNYENKIEFLCTKSNIYYQLYDEMTKYLYSQFGEEGLKSIFYHEIIHWLRLIPYKIEKLGERSLLFFATLIIVLNDVEERFEKNETCNF